MKSATKVKHESWACGKWLLDDKPPDQEKKKIVETVDNAILKMMGRML